MDRSDKVTRAKTYPNEVTKRIILSVPMDGVKRLSSILLSAVGSTNVLLQSDIKKLDQFSLPTNSGDDSDVNLAAEVVTYEAVLNAAVNAQGARVAVSHQVITKFADYISLLSGGEVVLDYVRPVGDVTFIPVRLRRDQLALAFRFNPLRSLRPMPTFRPTSGLSIRGVERALAPSTLIPQSIAHSVGVFDGGIGKAQQNSLFFPSADVELTGSPEDSQFVQHGTAVVGAAMYGLVEDDEQVPIPYLPVESYRILPPVNVPNDLHCFWALDQIKAVIENGLHDVYNLSLGPRLPVADHSIPNRWTNELDELAWQKQVLIVVAAGNDGHYSPGTGLHRVQVPADMVNGLTVGACDIPAPQPKWLRSPESSYGPGRYGGRISPAVVQFGGTAVDPMWVLTAHGQLRKDAGTSFAAPVVTHALSGLINRLDSADPSTLRAFAVHFAERPRPMKMITEVGHGRAPLSFNASLICGPNNVHILYRDRILRKQDLSYEIPTPSGFSSKLELKITLAYASPTDPSDALEYTKASLDLTLRPNEEHYRFNEPGDEPRNVTALRGSAEAATAELLGWTPSRHPLSKTLTPSESANRSESWRRKEGKWETVRHFRLTLPAGSYLKPRLHMNYLAREFGALTDAVPPIPFALVVSVVDTDMSGELYDRIQAEYPMLHGVPALPSQVRT
ncbi:S8 family peptidase [Cryobacterium sp. GrIS_2_6]|uniref:S8 family peptidase n=1 Tax=Cryobacterium sp. GrIS_2_6 TaxID=3162785 RepID=UPI002E07C7C5|nr:subtilisin family serine protease [Cryobacterium psychrotolerans]